VLFVFFVFFVALPQVPDERRPDHACRICSKRDDGPERQRLQTRSPPAIDGDEGARCAKHE
jgi:hypothetical protein